MPTSAPTPADISPVPSSNKEEAPATPDSPEAREYRSDWNADEGKGKNENENEGKRAEKSHGKGEPDQAPPEKSSHAWPG